MTEIVVAGILAIGPTVGGLAAWRSARATRRQLQPSNGHSLGEELQEVNKRLDMITTDDQSHHEAIIAELAAHDVKDELEFALLRTKLQTLSNQRVSAAR